MVLISLQSVETDNGYQFKNDFSETIEIDPKASISVVNCLFERDNKYIVDLTNNQFEIQVGNENLITLAIAVGSYDATELADEIQRVLHNAYYEQGIYFNVGVEKGKFDISYSYEPLAIKASAPQKFTNIGPSSVTTPGTVNMSAVTFKTAEYVYSDGILETSIVPLAEYGGTYIQMEVDLNGQAFPTPDGTVDTGGFIFGLWSGTLAGAGPASAVKEITDNVNLTFLDSGMIFAKKSADNTTSVRFIEEGTQVGAALPWLLLDGDQYKIKLATDTQAGAGTPEYWYKRTGGKWRKFDSSQQTLGPAKWVGKSYSLIFGTDIPAPVGGGGGAPIFKNILYTPSGSNTNPANLVPAETLNHTYEKNKIHRSVFSNGDTIAANSGILSQLVDANEGSSIKFNIPKPPVTGAQIFQISIVDENQRAANVVQAAAEKFGSPWYYGTTDQAGGALANGKTNPAIFALEFLSNNRAIWTKSFMNGAVDGTNYLTNKKSPTIRNRVNAALVTANWTDTAVFTLGVLAESMEMFLDVSKSGDPSKKDTVRLLLEPYPKESLTGIKTFTVNGAGTGWTDATNFWFAYGNTYNTATAVVQMTGQADGTLAAPVIINSGTGYTIGDNDTCFLIDQTTGDEINPIAPAGATVPDLSVATLWTHNVPVTNNYGTTWKGGGATEGYRYVAQITNWQGAESQAQPPVKIEGFTLQSQAQPNAPVVTFKPRTPDTAFGDLIGFMKTSYTFDEKKAISSDGTSNINATQVHPNIVINVDNLPIKSYIGKAFRVGSTINTNPIGSQQGITRAVAVIPRHWEENGVSLATTGPYYYDYFPYSVPLNNAVEINVNEIEISIKNPDGTLATDITKANLLLNISKVDNMGEGSMGGGIGKPIKAPRNFDLLDIDKTLRESYAPLGSKAVLINKHQRADVLNTAVNQGPNKTNAL